MSPMTFMTNSISIVDIQFKADVVKYYIKLCGWGLYYNLKIRNMVFIGKQVIEKFTKSTTFRLSVGGNGESKQYIQPSWQSLFSLIPRNIL